MKREEFIRELEYLLQDISEADKADAIAYYRDYLEEAGDDHEEEAIREFGSPERVAAIIRADLEGSLGEGGEFTESGYQDERFRDPRYQVAERPEPPDVTEAEGVWQEAGEGQADYGRNRGRKGKGGRFGFGEGRQAYERKDGPLSKGSPGSQVIKVILIVALICVASPVFLGVGGGILGIATGLLALLAAAVALAAVLTVAAWIGAIALLVLGAGAFFVYPWSGILLIGCGIFVMGLAFLGIVVSILVYGKLVPFFICGVANWLNHLLYRRRGSV